MGMLKPNRGIFNDTLFSVIMPAYFDAPDILYWLGTDANFPEGMANKGPRSTPPTLS